MNQNEFVEAVQNLANRFDEDKRSLEEFLRSLLGQLPPLREIEPSFELFARLLENSFALSPVSFNSKWMQKTTPSLEPKGFMDFEQTLLFQIADLHAMAEKNLLDDPHRSLGIDSPTGHRWFNFEPCNYLECAAAGFDANNLTSCSWGMMSEFLELGRYYE